MLKVGIYLIILGGKIMEIKGNIYIWGMSNRGRQVEKVLAEDGIKICGFIDTYNPDAIKPKEFFMSNHDDSVIIIASNRPDFVNEITSEIKKANYSGRVITSYDFHHQYEIPYFSEHAEHKYEIDFESKMHVWFDNFLSEVKFWQIEVAKPGSHYWTHYQNRISPKEFRGYIENRVKQGDIVLDVGCGICSQYGDLLKDNSKINLIGIDPLAPFYNQINDVYFDAVSKQESERVKVKFGMFELLSVMLGENYADYILIDNALDHCIDPFSAVVECLKTLKIGGMLVTSHHIDEAYKAFYSDLHQWNICADQNNDFVFWNSQNYININKHLSEYVDIEINVIHRETLEQPYGCVVCYLKKKKDLPIELSADLRQRSGFVIAEMMEKMSSTSYACDLLRLKTSK